MFIMGGVEIEPDKQDSDSPAILDTTFMIDFKQESVSQPFIANERPSKRYGHI